MKQWSFCERCKGHGCKECDYSGKTVKLVSLDSIPKILQREYIEMQRESFTDEQISAVPR